MRRCSANTLLYSVLTSKLRNRGVWLGSSLLNPTLTPSTKPSRIEEGLDTPNSKKFRMKFDISFTGPKKRVFGLFRLDSSHFVTVIGSRETSVEFAVWVGLTRTQHGSNSNIRSSHALDFSTLLL